MSLHLEFEPHSWYRGFAIKHNDGEFIGADDPVADEDSEYCADGCRYVNDGYRWEAYAVDGMFYRIINFHAETLADLKAKIKGYRKA